MSLKLERLFERKSIFGKDNSFFSCICKKNFSTLHLSKMYY